MARVFTRISHVLKEFIKVACRENCREKDTPFSFEITFSDEEIFSICFTRMKVKALELPAELLKKAYNHAEYESLVIVRGELCE